MVFLNIHWGKDLQMPSERRRPANRSEEGDQEIQQIVISLCQNLLDREGKRAILNFFE